jgi:large subunit ribosomal protein L17
MNHRSGFNTIERMAAHRKAMCRNMATSLFKYESIVTTKTKAKAVRVYAERLITRSKVDSVHNRRIVSARLFDEGIVAKLFTDIGVRMKDRNGGYTRILKLNERFGDAAQMVVLELVDYKLNISEKKEKNAKKEKGNKDEKDGGKAKADTAMRAGSKAKFDTKEKPVQKMRKRSISGE